MNMAYNSALMAAGGCAFTLSLATASDVYSNGISSPFNIVKTTCSSLYTSARMGYDVARLGYTAYQLAS